MKYESLERKHGFTLIEVMIVVAILGILAAVAYPSYSDYIRKSRRADGLTALLSVQLAQERVRANCRFYADTLSTSDSCGANAVATTINIASTSPEGFYTLDVTSASTVGYTATATAVGDQTQDDEAGVSCSPLTLTVTASSPEGVKGPSQCW